jgi:hypothetical protein
MSLFKIKDLKTEYGPKQFSFQTAKAPTARLELLSTRNLKSMLEQLQPDQSIKYMTKGAWSMHELLEMLLQKTGPAKVWITTWTITENPLRTLLRLSQEGQIQSLTALLDHRIGKRAPKALQFAEGIVSKLKLVNIHAKTLVISNENWGVSVVSTANFSKNNRIEAGVISTCRADSDFDIKWIEEVYAND